MPWVPVELCSLTGMVPCRRGSAMWSREGAVDGDGQAGDAAGVVVHCDGSTVAVAGSPVLPKAQCAAGPGRVRPAGGTAMPGLLRAGRAARPQEHSAGRVL